MYQDQPIDWMHITNRLEEFDDYPEQPPVGWKDFHDMSPRQARRLQEELAKPQNSPDNRSFNVNELMKSILVEVPE